MEAVLPQMKHLSARLTLGLVALCLWGCFAGGFGLVHVPPDELSRMDQIELAITSPTGDCSKILGNAWLISTVTGGGLSNRTLLYRALESSREVLLRVDSRTSLHLLDSMQTTFEYYFEFEFDNRHYRHPKSGTIVVPTKQK